MVRTVPTTLCMLPVRARRPPAILHTSSEARQEGLRYYALTDFDVNSTFLIPTPIYFNGFIDIVFFGKNTCLNTLGILLRSGLNNMTVSRQSVSRVAFDVDAPGQLCLCDLNCEGRWSGVQFGQSLFGYREIFDHEAQLKALHGVDSDYPQEAGFWPGCRQLKEIIFITKGYDLALSAEELSFIDDSVTLRPAGIRYESDLWNVDHKLKNVLVRVVKKVRDGNYSPSSTYLPPPSRWSTNPPSISFQHLYLHDEAQRVHQNLILSVSSKYLMNTVKDLAYSFEPGRLVRVSFYQKFREDGAAIFKVIGVRDEVGKVLGKIRRRLRLLESTLVLPRHAIREIQDEDSPFSFS